eukprot:701365-Rhodomonas_salina.2
MEGRMPEVGEKRGAESGSETEAEAKRQMTTPAASGSSCNRDLCWKGRDICTVYAYPQLQPFSSFVSHPAFPEGHNQEGPASPEPDELALPQGWCEHVSKRTGKVRLLLSSSLLLVPFWYNPTTKERTWIHPAIVKPPVRASPSTNRFM